jgi:hypothetical protein
MSMLFGRTMCVVAGVYFLYLVETLLEVVGLGHAHSHSVRLVDSPTETECIRYRHCVGRGKGREGGACSRRPFRVLASLFLDGCLLQSVEARAVSLGAQPMLIRWSLACLRYNPTHHHHHGAPSAGCTAVNIDTDPSVLGDQADAPDDSPAPVHVKFSGIPGTPDAPLERVLAVGPFLYHCAHWRVSRSPGSLQSHPGHRTRTVRLGRKRRRPGACASLKVRRVNASLTTGVIKAERPTAWVVAACRMAQRGQRRVAGCHWGRAAQLCRRDLDWRELPRQPGHGHRDRRGRAPPRAAPGARCVLAP